MDGNNVCLVSSVQVTVIKSIWTKPSNKSIKEFGVKHCQEKGSGQDQSAMAKTAPPSLGHSRCAGLPFP